MAENYGAFVDSPIASDIALARLHRRWGPDGVVADGPDALDRLEVSANSTSQVTVAPGYCLVGGWFYRTDTDVKVNITPNPSGAERRDLLVVRADPAQNEAYLHIREGTPGSGSWPSPVRDPSGPWDLPLARLTIAGGSSVVTLGDVDTSVRQYTAPTGAIPCTSNTRPGVAHQGMLIWETDTRLLLVHEGTYSSSGMPTYRTLIDTSYPTAWQPITLRAGYTQATHGFAPAWRFLAPGRVELRGTIARSNGATLPNGEYYARLPTAARPAVWVRQVVAAESRNTGGEWAAYARIAIASPGASDYLAGQVVFVHRHEPRFVHMDGVIYDVA